MQMRRPSIPVQKFQKWNNPQSGQVHYTYAPAGGITWLRVVFRPLFLFAPFIIGPSYAWLRKHSVTHRTAIPPASRRHLRTCGECVKIYAASSCVSDFSWRRMSNGKRLRCVAEWLRDRNHALVVDGGVCLTTGGHVKGTTTSEWRQPAWRPMTTTLTSQVRGRADVWVDYDNSRLSTPSILLRQNILLTVIITIISSIETATSTRQSGNRGQQQLRTVRIPRDVQVLYSSWLQF